jgi:ethanolamine utilization microcompartment shell protein EutL
MKDHLIALIEAVHRSQNELVSYIEADKAGTPDARRTVGELCGILGDEAVIEAMVNLASAIDVRLAPLDQGQADAALKH